MLALALAAGCASQKSAESHADYVAQTQTVRTEGAERVTVLEFGPQAAAPGVTPDPTYPEAERRTKGIGSGGFRPQPSDSLPAHGPLLKATVIDRAPIVTETHSGTDVHTDAESASRWNLGFGFWTKVLIAAGAALALLLARRFRSGLLGAGLRLLGK